MATGWPHWAEISGLLAWSLILVVTLGNILLGSHQRRQNKTSPTTTVEIPPKNSSKSLTLRIQEIPTNVTQNELLSELENLSHRIGVSRTGDTNVIHLSLVRRDKRGACATVTFRSLPQPLEDIERESRIVHRYAYDIKFLGITPVYEGHGQRDSIVDVIAVPGLGSHPIGTWKASGSDDVWLRDFLPSDVPDTRVLLYGYDTALAKSDSKQSIVDLAKTFLELIKAFRITTSTNHRPIIFIGHSLGGLLVKEALSLAIQAQGDSEYTNIYKSCYALLLFGVPNLGMRNDQLRSIVKGQPNKRLIDDLVVDKDSEPSSFLSSLSRRFADCCLNQGFEVISFYERSESPTVVQKTDGTLTRSGPKQLLVTEESATRTGLPDMFHQHIPLDTDHSGLVKFESRSHGSYEIVMQKIKKYVAEAPEAISKRFIPRLSPAQERCLKHLATFPVSEVRDRISDAENGTLQWVSLDPKIDQWQKSDVSGLLCIYGSPGQGKSVLCKNILEKLEQKVQSKQETSSHKIIYFFCSGQLDPRFQNAETILRALIVQLLSSPQMFTHLPLQYQKRAEYWDTAPLARLWAIFHDMISDECHHEICCLIDGLDEFESGIIDLLERIRRLFSSLPVTKRPTIKFLIVSRHKKNISNALANSETLYLRARYEDIQRFIGAKLKELDSALERFKPVIEEKLAAKAGPTFLWISIVIKRIKRLDLPNQKKIIREIEDSPPELDELYQILVEVLLKDEDTARLLTWVTFARKPLSLMELETALALRPEKNCRCTKDTKEYRTYLTERSVNKSAGLLLEVRDGKVYLIHQSLKDFLSKADNPLSASDFLHAENPDTFLARACIRYLDFDDFESAALVANIRDNPERREEISQHTLLEYASRHWYSHVRSDGDASLLSSEFSGILWHENFRAQLWFTVASGQRTEYTTRGSVAIELDIDWLARFIFHDEKDAVKKDLPVDCLTTVVAKGGQVLKALLDYGEPYLSGVTEEVMKAAAQNINGERVMTLLLNRLGNDIQITEEVVREAAMNSNEATMTLLMDRMGDDIQITERVVEAAAWNFNGESMALLLDRRGDDVQITQKVVEAAAQNWNGKRAMTILLNRRGNDIQITQEVVEAAALNYNGEVMAVLLGQRANEIELTEELTAWIASRFDVEVMTLLLDRRGDDVQITDKVVKASIMNRYGKEVLELLLDRRGDDIRITEEFVKAAASKFYTGGVMALLLDRRGDEIQITEELTALMAERSSVEAMSMLLYRRGDDLQITEKVLVSAARNYDENVVALLLDQQDDIQITEEVVKAAAGNRNGAIMTMLLDRLGDDFQITEEVLKAVEGNWSDGSVMRRLLGRRGDVQCTEDVIETTVTADEKHVL